MQQSDYQFDVFLSYSRKDEEFARRLEEALENYTLPKYVKARSISRKRLNVFRDKKDLVPNDADYYKTIAGYLNRSQYLVVVCSPNARNSEYVNHEIRIYLQSHEPNRVIPVLLSGKPNNDTQAKPEEYAFPQALCDALAMPLAVEFTEFERTPGKLSKGRYHDSWYTLLSKIFGTERAEIERLDAKRQARRRAIFAGVSLAVTAVLSVALVFAIISRQQAASERDHAQQLLYASDMNLAQRAFESGNVGLGRNLLESHRPKSGERDLRGFEWYYLWQLYNGHLASFEATEDLAFMRDGSRFATVTDDAIKIWDTASRRETANIPLGPPNSSETDGPQTLSIDFSPDGNTVAYGDSKRGTLLFDLASGSLRKVPFPTLAEKQRQSSALRDEESIQRYWDFVGAGSPRFSPDGKLLALDYSCGVAAVFDAKSLRQITTLGDGPPASGCASFVTFSPDGKLLAYGNGYGVGLWDTVTRNDLSESEAGKSLTNSIAQLESVAFSPDSRVLAIGDRERQVVLWSISTRKVVGRLNVNEGWFSALAFSPDGRTLYTGGLDQTVKMWNLSSLYGDCPMSENLRPFGNIKGHTDSIVSIKCAANGKIIATVGADHTVKLWADTAGREFEQIDQVETAFPQAYMAVRSAGEGFSNTVTFFDLSAQTRSSPVNVDSTPAAISRDGKILALASSRICWEESPCTLDLVEADSQRKLMRLPIYDSRPFASFSLDNRLFSVLGRGGKSVMLWDTVEKKELPPINNDVELESFLVSPDGKVIVTFDKDGKIKSWEIASQRQLAQIVRNKKPENAVYVKGLETDPHVLSPDGQFLAFSDSNKVELWQVKSADAPAVVGDQDMRGRVSVIAFSPDGKTLAAGDVSGTVRIWDSATRKELGTFMGHKDIVTTFAFTPDGRTLASGGGARDAAVKVYGLSTMRELLTLTHEPGPKSESHAGEGSEDHITQLFFSEDGRALITLSDNSILRIWRGNANPT